MSRILSPQKNAPEHDIVFTPLPLAKEIIDHFSPHGSILDPCMGNGAFFDQYPDHCEKFWCEISKGQDFFDFDTKVDWIITNPPWSKMKEFISHGINVSDNVVYLVSINHYMTKARMRIIFNADFGFKEIYGVKTPKENWPQSGFQLAAVHLEKGWKGPTLWSGEFG
jgi:hypothetical protein